jgi:hypothetical protein
VGFFRRRLCCIGGAASVAVLAASYLLWPRDREPSSEAAPTPAFSFEELCRDDLENGWRVKHPPDVPGPYRRRLAGFWYYHPGPDGSCTVRLRDAAGAVYWEEQTRPGIDFLTVVLETPDGRRTEGLLVRGE